MQPSPKLKASQGAQAMTIQTKPQRAKGTRNSPKADQNKVKDTLKWHLNVLYMVAYTRVQTWSIRHQPFKALKEHQMQAYKHAIWTEMT